jgi:signal transduction histidine kinase
MYGALAVERPTVLIVSDEAEFSRAVSTRWQAERVSPSFLLFGGGTAAQLQNSHFDLAIVGAIGGDIAPLLESLQASARPVIHISRLNNHSPRLSGVVEIPETEAWPELLITLAQHILERERIAADLARLLKARSQLEREASLGRYMLEMRHNLNNALTSILGNSELILLDSQSNPSSLRLQIETIRNMGMRMNEILQRFTSLQKEMQLVEQQSCKKASRGATAGA